MSKNKTKKKVHLPEMIDVKLLFTHPNNTNVQSKHVFNELRESIKLHGFDEPCIAVPRDDGEPGYWVVAGNHRLEAGKAEGYEELPVIIRDDWDAIESRIQLVRRNLVRGEIDRVKFTEEVNKLVNEANLGLDVIQERMGFSDAENFSDFYKEEKKRERRIANAVASSAPQVKMLDDLGQILSVMFEKYGSTVTESFIIFPLGGRNHMFLQATPALKKAIDAITLKCVADGLDINTVLGGLLQIAIHHSDFMKTKENHSKIIEEGSIKGDSNINLVEKK